MRRRVKCPYTGSFWSAVHSKYIPDKETKFHLYQKIKYCIEIWKRKRVCVCVFALALALTSTATSALHWSDCIPVLFGHRRRHFVKCSFCLAVTSFVDYKIYSFRYDSHSTHTNGAFFAQCKSLNDVIYCLHGMYEET